MSKSIDVLAFAGSLRRASINRGLVRAAAQLEVPGLAVSSFDLADVPLYNGDVEAVGDPAPVAELKQAISAADALLIATPEYNRGVPGVLKNALDWASRPPEKALEGKPVALMGATPGGFGTRAAQFQVRHVLGNPGAPVMPKPELWVSGATEKFDENGDLTDEPTRQALEALLHALRDWLAPS